MITAHLYITIIYATRALVYLYIYSRIDGVGNAVIHFSIALYYVEYFLIRLKSKLNAWFCRYMWARFVRGCGALDVAFDECVDEEIVRAHTRCEWNGTEMKLNERKPVWMFWIQCWCLNDSSNTNGFMELFLFVIHVSKWLKGNEKFCAEKSTHSSQSSGKIMYTPYKHSTPKWINEFVWEQYRVMRNYAMIAHLFRFSLFIFFFAVSNGEGELIQIFFSRQVYKYVYRILFFVFVRLTIVDM